MEQYHYLLNSIIQRGSYKEPAREGMPGTTSLFGYQFRHDLAKGFPLLTTKKMFWKGIVVELLWFLRGDTNIKFLDEHGVTKMWHQDAYNYYRQNFEQRSIYGTEAEVKMKQEEKPMSFDEFCKIIHETERKDLPTVATNNGNYTFGDCGYQYGKQWRAWDTGKSMVTGHNGSHNEFGVVVVDQIANVLKSLREQPYGRRHIVTAIDPAHEKNLALYWCHAMFQFNCRKLTLEQRYTIYSRIPRDQKASLASDKFGGDDNERHEDLDGQNIPRYYLDCQLYQRSCDVFLGVPYNIASYALLTHILAKMLNMEPGEYIHTFGDVHIYDNHREAVNTQLANDYTKYPLATLKLNPMIDWVKTGDELAFDLLSLEDFALENYQSYPKIEAELSTGMKK